MSWIQRGCKIVQEGKKKKGVALIGKGLQIIVKIMAESSFAWLSVVAKQGLVTVLPRKIVKSGVAE